MTLLKRGVIRSNQTKSLEGMVSQIKAILIIGLTLFSNVGHTAVDRIDPPNWFAGMASPDLQLMVYGEDISEAKVVTDHPDVKIVDTTPGDSSNYLFVDLEMDKNISAGTIPLTFEYQGEVIATWQYPLQKRESGSAQRQSFSPKDVIYLVVPDRFANGDEGNDQLLSMKEGLDRDHHIGRHGGDIQGIINHLDYLQDLGITQLWITPMVENNMTQMTYHGYSATDLYRIDPRFGSNELYAELSRRAAGHGIGIIHDLVPNHIGSEHPWMSDLPFANWINYGGKFVSTNSRREAIQDIHAASSDRKRMSNGWFVETMPDMNFDNPFVTTYQIQNSIWWIETAGLSGYRIDTWPYIQKAFMRPFTDAVLREYPNFNLVGEETAENPINVSYWQRGKINQDGFDSGLPSLMDFPLRHALVQAVTEEENWNSGLVRIYQSLSSDFIYPDPDNLVILADNHDQSRIFTQLDEHLDRFEMVMTFLMTTRGIPQILYGTEILMANPGTGEHGIIRSDFPGGWRGDKINAFTGEGLTAVEKGAQQFITKLLNWRKGADAIHNGKLIHYAPFNGLYTYFRVSDRQKVMVIMNNSNEMRRVDTAQYADTIGNAVTGIEVINGAVVNIEKPLVVPEKSAVILELR